MSGRGLGLSLRVKSLTLNAVGEGRTLRVLTVGPCLSSNFGLKQLKCQEVKSSIVLRNTVKVDATM